MAQSTSDFNNSLPTDVLGDMNDTERDQWLKDGTMPEPKAKEETGETVVEQNPADKPADKPEEVVDTKEEVEVQTGKTGDRKKQISDQIHEAIAKRDQIRAELVEEENKKANSKKAEVKAEAKTEPKTLKEKVDVIRAKAAERIASDQNANYDDIMADMMTEIGRVSAEETIREDRTREAERSKAKEVAEVNKVIEKQWVESVKMARTIHEDFDAVALDPTLPILQGTVADSFVLESAHGTEVLYYLGQHRDELDRINKLNPIAQARELVKIEMKIASPEKTDKVEKIEKTEVAPKPVSKAPPPSREVGTRTVSHTDEAVEALNAGDFESYQRVQNERQFSKFKR